MITKIKLLAANDVFKVADKLDSLPVEWDWFLEDAIISIDYDKLDEADKQGLININLLTEEDVDE